MAYNNGFPVTYQPIYQQYPQVQPQAQQVMPQPQPQQAQPQQQSNLIWVSGEAGAKAYLVAPNTTVQLWDSESQTIYLKSADGSGMPSIKTLDYTIRDTGTPVQATEPAEGKYIQRDELNALNGRIQALEREISKLKPKKKEGGHNG